MIRLLITPDLPIAMAPALVKTAYDPKMDLSPVAVVGGGVLLAHPFAPAKTPAALSAAIRDDLRRVFDDADTNSRLVAAGVDPLWMDDKELAATIDHDLAKWIRVVRESNIKGD